MTFFSLFLFLTLGDVKLQATQPDCLTIRQIRVATLDVFAGSKEPTRFQKAFQLFHATTREKVVRAELLFASGDCLNKELIRETERNLRRMHIFSDAYVTQSRNSEKGGVDLVVTTHDRFTLRMSLGISRKGGINKQRGSLGEANLLGRNTSLHYTYESRSDGNRINRIIYTSPRLWRHFRLSSYYASTDEGTYRSFSLAKPFWSLNQQNAFSISGFLDQTRSDFYQDGGVENEVDNDIAVVRLGFNREIGDRHFSRRLRLSGTYKEEAYGLGLAPFTVPDATTSNTALAGFAWKIRKNFVVRHGINSMIKREDISLASGGYLDGGLQARETEDGMHYHRMLKLGFHHVGMPNPDQLISLHLGGQQRYWAGKERASRLNAFYHHYFFASNSQTWVGGVAFDYRYTQDGLYLPLTLGEDRGLRGYDAFTFTGNKTLIINLEHRFTYPRRSRRFALGQALFVDGGNAWKPNEAANLMELSWGVGWGLRLDMPALFGRKVLRFDIAYPLDSGKISVSFSAGHIFSHDSASRGFDRDF